MKRLLVIAIAGCGSSQAAAPWEPPAPAGDGGRILEVANSYRDWGRVDENLRVVPAPCAAAASSEDMLRTSEATDGPHAEKKYFLYANDRSGYIALRVKSGFAIVKESIDVAGRPSDLFVMARVDRPTSDAGWIYGTVSPAGKLTSAGRVEACMSCHVEAAHDRLFGIRSAEVSR